MEYGLSGLPKKERERALPFGRIEAFGKKIQVHRPSSTSYAVGHFLRMRVIEISLSFKSLRPVSMTTPACDERIVTVDNDKTEPNCLVH